jgi:hypothetical protein
MPPPPPTPSFKSSSAAPTSFSKFQKQLCLLSRQPLVLGRKESIVNQFLFVLTGSFLYLVVLTLTVYLFLLWSTVVKNGISDYRRKLLAYPLVDVYVSHKHIGKQNPFIYTVKAVTFFGEKGGW